MLEIVVFKKKFLLLKKLYLLKEKNIQKLCRKVYSGENTSLLSKMLIQEDIST